MSALEADPRPLADARVIVLPGGFSYGDDLGAGRVWALQLQPGSAVGDALALHIERGRVVVGICNGFQALVKAGLLGTLSATLTRNAHSRFVCHWVTLRPNPRSPSPFIRELREPIRCPIAHGEGRLVFGDASSRAAARDAALGAFSYGENPNGSDDDLAGLTNAEGNVLGLMPHPEDHVLAHQHPDQHRGGRDGSGLPLFSAILRHAATL